MSSSKISKRKSQSTVTLHDFFDAGAHSSLKAKGKQKATPVRNQRPKQNLVSPENVIVIDCDSDSEPEAVQLIRKKQKRRLSVSFGEVEFVDNAATNVRRPATTTSNTSQSSRESPPRNGKSTKLSTLPDPSTSARLSFAPDSATPEAKEMPVFPFGAPTLLLNTTSAASTSANSKPTSNVLGFGSPTLLLGSNSVPILSNQGASTSRAPPPAEGHSPDEGFMMDLGLPADVTDDWGTGDDETAFTREPDEEEEELEDMSVDASPIGPADDVTKCPSCDMSLDGFSHLVSSEPLPEL
ncbi:hypothetical protein FPV67DRAFT_604613 [Lyophyllum atratum]|nr:hypothetical protein FPV67DRAFT_604613 [Lyophyllum atratum]